jgi:hypothetical protein
MRIVLRRASTLGDERHPSAEAASDRVRPTIVAEKPPSAITAYSITTS